MNSSGIEEYLSTTLGYFLVPSFIKEKQKMANFVQITGLRTYPSRKYSTRTVEQNVPFIQGIRKYICFSYDYHKYTELLNILYEGGEFKQQEKKSEIPTVYSFNKDTLEFSIKCSSNKRLSCNVILTKEVLEDIIKAIEEDANETISDNRVRKEAESLDNKIRTTDWRSKHKPKTKTSELVPETAPESTKDDLPSIPKPNEESFTTAQINDNNDSVVSIVSETAPESPKEEKVEEIKLNEETLATDQINDNNDSIIGQSVTETKQEEVKTKTVWDVKEVKDIVFKVEKIDENKLDEVSLGKKSEIAGYFWPSHEALLAKLYGIRVPTKENGEPDKEAYKEIREYFGKIFNVAV